MLWKREMEGGTATKATWLITQAIQVNSNSQASRSLTQVFFLIFSMNNSSIDVSVKNTDFCNLVTWLKFSSLLISWKYQNLHTLLSFAATAISFWLVRSKCLFFGHPLPLNVTFCPQQAPGILFGPLCGKKFDSPRLVIGLLLQWRPKKNKSFVEEGDSCFILHLFFILYHS